MRALSSFLLLILHFIPTGASAQNFYDWTRKADTLFREKKYAQSSVYFEKAMHAIREVYISPGDFSYCAASFAMAGNADKAFFYLTKAVDKGGITSTRLEHDDDFTSLKKLKKWSSIIKEAKEIEAEWNVKLMEQLKVIRTKDQFNRKKMDSLFQRKGSDRSLLKHYELEQKKLDSLIFIETEEILRNGFPTRKQVGNENEVLFLVIQHSNLKAREKYYPLFERAAENGDLNWKALSIMSDRIRVNKGLKQIYGSQIHKDSTGKIVLYPIEDFQNLNKRRLKIGLDPIEEYVSYWGIKL